MADAPTVAIIADSPLQRQRVQRAAEKYGLRTAFVGDPQRFLSLPGMPDVALWVLVLADEDDHPDLIDQLLEKATAPILFGLGLAPEPSKVDYARWERRFFAKLMDQLGELEQLDSAQAIEALEQTPPVATPSKPNLLLSSWIKPADISQKAEQVWILGASLGGPAAVKEFLDQLPPGLPVAFVYAQHIDAHFAGVLTRVLGRHSQYQLAAPVEGEALRCCQVVMMPVERELYFDEVGCIRFKDTPWPGPYGPSIDQVMLNVANCYGNRCHAIIFSGMGNDGAIAAPLLSAYGSKIWAQESSSCANSAMPDSVVASGCVTHVAKPAELAAQLVRTIEAQCLLAGRQRRDTA